MEILSNRASMSALKKIGLFALVACLIATSGSAGSPGPIRPTSLIPGIGAAAGAALSIATSIICQRPSFILSVENGDLVEVHRHLEEAAHHRMNFRELRLSNANAFFTEAATRGHIDV